MSILKTPVSGGKNSLNNTETSAINEILAKEQEKKNIAYYSGWRMILLYSISGAVSVMFVYLIYYWLIYY